MYRQSVQTSTSTTTSTSHVTSTSTVLVTKTTNVPGCTPPAKRSLNEHFELAANEDAEMEIHDEGIVEKRKYEERIGKVMRIVSW
jgi:hypothetical protein